MKTVFCFLFCALFVCSSQSQIHITSSPQEIRKPDLSIPVDQTKQVAAIAYNLNGRFLAVAGGDKAIRIFDARPGDRLIAKLSQTPTGHTFPILGISFSDTNRLVSVAMDQTAKTWDMASGKLLHSTEINFGKQLIPAFAPAGQPLLAGGTLSQIRLWNYQTGELLHTLEANDSNVSALAFTPDGKLLVVGTTKGVVRVIDVAAWKVTRSIDLDTPIYSLAASANHILVGYGDGTLALLNFTDQSSIPELKKQTGAINAVAFSLTGEQFASASADKTVKVWDTETLKLLGSLEGHNTAVTHLAFNSNGQKLASSSEDGTVNYWTVPAATPVKSP